MALEEIKYVVLFDGAITQTPKESWPEAVRRWLVQCPSCAEARLVVGARENELYTCRDCGHRFNITILGDANDLSDRESDSR